MPQPVLRVVFVADRPVGEADREQDLLAEFREGRGAVSLKAAASLAGPSSRRPGPSKPSSYGTISRTLEKRAQLGLREHELHHQCLDARGEGQLRRRVARAHGEDLMHLSERQ